MILRRYALPIFMLSAIALISTTALARGIVLTDPAGDDHGPGTYVHPASVGFRPGTFDLREVSFERTAGGVTIKVSFAISPQVVKVRTNRDDPGRDVFMPVIDIYTASNPSAGSGHDSVLPGRRIALSGGFGWDRAVVISALPDLLRSHYGRAVPSLAADTCFPTGVRLLGRTIRAFVPDRCLHGDLESIYFLVIVTGLGPGAGFGDFLRRTPGDHAPDAVDPFVREVTADAGTCNVWEDGVGRTPCTFGGCRPCGWHPFVLDAIVPSGMDQEDLLGTYSKGQTRLASLPFTTASGDKAPSFGPAENSGTEPKHGLRLKVSSVRGRQISIRKFKDLDAGTIGALVCPGERPGGTVVVKGEAAGFIVLEKVGDDTPPCSNASVEF